MNSKKPVWVKAVLLAVAVVMIIGAVFSAFMPLFFSN